MATIKQPAKVSSITVSGSTLTPVSGKITPTDDLSTALNHQHSRPRLVRSFPNGDVVIRLPLVVSSITIDGTTYTPTAAGEITLTAAAGTQYLEETKYIP